MDKSLALVTRLLDKNLSVCSRCGVVVWKRLQNEHAQIHLNKEPAIVFHMHDLGNLLLESIKGESAG